MRPISAANELRTYLAAVLPGYRAELDPQTGEPTFAARLEFQRLLYAGGWAAPGWPSRHGGRDLSIAERLQCDEVCAEFDAPLPAGVLGLANVGPALIEFGTTEQQESLPCILEGSEIWCQGFSEPDAGSDLASLRTRATRVEDGFVVNGQKVWTSNGMDATHCMLLARTDTDAGARRGISVLLVSMDTPGIERRPITMTSGETEFAELFFTDVRVPESALLGRLHDGWRVTVRTLEHERAGVLGRAAALERKARQAITELAAHTAAQPAMRDQLAARYVDAKVLGLLGGATLTKAEQGIDIGSEQALVKLAWGIVDRALAETVVDAGGVVAAEGPLTAARGMLFTRASTIAAGTTEILKNLLAERVLGLPR